MAKVYVVTSGEYSDYGIERVFSNLAAAESFQKSYDAVHSEYNRTNEYIEEYDLLDTDPGMWQEHLFDCFITGPGEGQGRCYVRKRTDERWRTGPTPNNRPVVEIVSVYVNPDNDHWRKEGKVGQLQVTIRGSGADRDNLHRAIDEKVVHVMAEWFVYQEQGRQGGLSPSYWEPIYDQA